MSIQSEEVLDIGRLLNGLYNISNASTALDMIMEENEEIKNNLSMNTEGLNALQYIMSEI